MGTSTSSLRQPHSIFITATACDDKRPFTVEVLSPEAIAEGASSAVLKGTIVAGSGRQPAVVALKVFRLPLNAEYRELYQTLYQKELAAAQLLGANNRFILPFVGTAVLGPFKVHRQGLVTQIAEAVRFLHTDAGLVHGDLKCENVLISDYGRALLADLGLSTVIEKAESNATTSTSIRQWNTVRFAAPELLSDHAQTLAPQAGVGTRLRSKTTQSDVYAFGMLILQIFTGQLPWPDCTSEVVMMKVLSPAHAQHPRPGDEVTSLGLSDAWWRVCLKCWAFVPAWRPSISTVLRELRANECAHWMALPHTSHVRAVAYLPGGSRVVSADGNALRIWDTSSRSVAVGPLMCHEDSVLCLAVSPDGRHIASGSSDRTIRRWDAESGIQLGRPIRAHTGAVTCIAYSPNGAYLVSGATDGAVLIWTPGERSVARCLLLTQHTHPVLSLAFCPSGTTIASGYRDGVWLTTSRGEHIALLGCDLGPVHSLCFSANGRQLISGFRDGTMRIWDTATQELRFTVWGHYQTIKSLAVLPSGRYIVSSSSDKTIRIWDADTGAPVGRPLLGHRDSVDAVGVSLDGKSIVSGSRDRTVRIWHRFE